MGLGKIVRMFRDGNVCVCGLRGTGKDMLFGNVIARRRNEYISNVNYGGSHLDFSPSVLDCCNTYDDFIRGSLTQYRYPYPDGVDFYISDVGVYFPSHYCNELNRKYGFVPTFMALSRHLGDCNVHFNVQNLNRAWDKLREQSDLYIRCNWCKVLFGKLVFQKVTVYELYDSAVKRVPPFPLSRPWLSAERIFQWKVQKSQYDISHGGVESKLLIYWNKARYNTRIFKEVLENA